MLKHWYIKVEEMEVEADLRLALGCLPELSCTVSAVSNDDEHKYTSTISGNTRCSDCLC